MLRKIIYGNVGFIIWGAVGFIIHFTYFILNDALFWPLVGVSGVICAFLSFWAASRINQKEKQYFVNATDVASRPLRSNFHIINVIFGIQAVIGLTIFAISVFVFYKLSGISLPFLPYNLTDFLNRYEIIVGIFSILMSIASMWVGVWYVSKKGFLKNFHSPLKISSGVAIINAVLGYKQIIHAPSVFILSLMVTFCLSFYFLDRAVKKLN